MIKRVAMVVLVLLAYISRIYLICITIQVAIMVLVLLVFPLIGQGFDRCGALGCEHEMRELRERVRELERDEGDELREAEIRRRIGERHGREKREGDRVREWSPFSGEGRIHEGAGR
jgi:hypothetical protein